MSDPNLDDCGCCEGPSAATVTPENPPGLPALAYRVGTHGRFNAALHLGLVAQPALRALATRDPSDPAIALLDAWAVVLDVLTFYQERIANEGFLRTATERRSLLELARAIGYELRPGVAAGTCLAFTMDNVTGSPVSVQLAIGTKAQSVPAQDEKPQTFETVEEIEARPEWNALKPQLFVSSLPLEPGKKKVWLQGTTTGLKAGDALLFIGDERKNDPGSKNWDFRRVASLENFPLPPTSGAGAGYTAVTLDDGLGTFIPPVGPEQKHPGVYALRQRAGLFGYNAVDWKALPDVTKAAYLNIPVPADPTTLELREEKKEEWPNFTVFPTANTLDLDAVYPKIVAGRGWLVLSIPTYQEVYRIDAAVESARAEFGLSGKTTRITLGAGKNQDKFTDPKTDPKSLRTAVVYAESEQLQFAEKPRTDDVSGGEILIAPAVTGLKPGRLLSVTGTDVASGKSASEVVEIKTVENIGDTTRITLVANLTGTYQRDTVTINANVARATHGETKKDEVLGSGDGSLGFQRFTLKQKPLTYVSAPVPGGAASTLEVRVKGVLWHEVPSFYEAESGDRAYVTRRADDGSVTVQFGDGTTGARLPTGTNNVTATYRTGIGLDGLLDAATITTLLSRPLGLKAATNPIPATGAGDPEKLADARTNAPLTVLTLDRIVSVQDFEDFARAFAGIGKAQATLLWNGERQLVHLTVAGADGTAVDPTSDSFKSLLDGIDAARHADQPVRVSPHTALTFTLSARVAVDRDLIQADVLAAVRTALTAAFAFEVRSFGQGVTASEVLAVMQNVPGVVAVDLDLLNGLDPIKHPNIPARVAHWDSTTIRGADLLLIDPDGITLTDLPL
jgi:hypothetical protein